MADPAKINAVIELIESGETETAACRTVGINRNTFRAAALKFGAADAYARATEALARDQVAKIEAVLDEMRGGEIDVDKARLEVDTRKWFAQRLFRPLWGDKVSTEVSGPGGAPVPVAISVDWRGPKSGGVE